MIPDQVNRHSRCYGAASARPLDQLSQPVDGIFQSMAGVPVMIRLLDPGDDGLRVDPISGVDVQRRADP
jgi:hypothetical protein